MIHILLIIIFILLEFFKTNEFFAVSAAPVFKPVPSYNLKNILKNGSFNNENASTLLKSLVGDEYKGNNNDLACLLYDYTVKIHGRLSNTTDLSKMKALEKDIYNNLELPLNKKGGTKIDSTNLKIPESPSGKVSLMVNPDITFGGSNNPQVFNLTSNIFSNKVYLVTSVKGKKIDFKKKPVSDLVNYFKNSGSSLSYGNNPIELIPIVAILYNDIYYNYNYILAYKALLEGKLNGVEGNIKRVSESFTSSSSPKKLFNVDISGGKLTVDGSSDHNAIFKKLLPIILNMERIDSGFSQIQSRYNKNLKDFKRLK